jgi:cyclopropane-fatty-acyl-phospholipid synthase
MIETLVDRGVLPDPVIRAGIRRVVAGRLKEQEQGGIEAQSARFASLLKRLRSSSIAIETGAANTQHYELPPRFFGLVLGPHFKYSSAWWPDGVETLEDAEQKMLDLTTERAQVEDGHRILELGCGWGSLTLHLARRFPASQIVAVSNSAPQREFITATAAAEGRTNIEVITADINVFDTHKEFDRIVSVEMLEHVRNHGALFSRISRWLAPGGRFFAHVFAHRRFAYLYEARSASDWMARYFFTGGMMPSDDLFLHHQDDLAVEEHWRLDGRHYQRTAETWLENFDRHTEEIDAILAEVYGPREVTRWRARWRVFFMACAEMFGYRDGQEWIVSHYRFKRRVV